MALRLFVFLDTFDCCDPMYGHLFQTEEVDVSYASGGLNSVSRNRMRGSCLSSVPATYGASDSPSKSCA